MKKFAVLFCSIISGIAVLGQPDYPAAPSPAVNLALLEYFFDIDPGAGNGMQVASPASTDAGSFSFTASLAGISSGFHRLYLRSRDVNAVWSHTHNAFFDTYTVPAYSTAPPVAGNIIETEYFIDTDPGVGNANKLITGPGADINSHQISINVTGLSIGVHRLYIRSRDENGKWSLTHFGIFDNSFAMPYPDAPQAAPPIGELEYYIDTDPGFGNGTAVSFTAGTDISNLSISIPLNSITAGQHTIYIRSRQNPWSLSAYADFTYASTLPVTWSYIRGEIRNGKAVINWATASEINTASFTVEHSTDGRKFTAVGDIDASGNTNSSHQYSFLHDGLKPGLNAYRIKQTDRDGRFSYSKIISLLYKNGSSQPALIPNPVTSSLYITGYENKIVQRVDFFDMAGKLVYSKPFTANQQLYSVDMSNMKAGIYVVRVHLPGITDTYKVYKQ